MNFLLNDEQRQLADSAREFLAAQSPVSLQRRLRDTRAPLAYDTALWQQVIDLGWPAAVFPEDEAGLAVGYMGLGAVFEAMGRTLAALPLLSSVALCGELLLAAGDAAQRARWLPGLMTGEARMALALDERGRHDPTRITTRARHQDAGWVLDGEKWFVMDGIGAQALMVVARVLGAAGEDEGLGLFVVETDQPGVTLAPTCLADSRNYARLTLTGAQVAGDHRLNEASDVKQALDAALDRACACLAAEALGVVREVFERTVSYLKERVQFDVVIGSFQALQHRVARLYVELEMLESCVRAALAAIDAADPELPLLASLAKARAADLCEKIANEAIQLHGGIGVTDEFDLGLFVKRARVLQQSLGDGLYHRNRYAQLKRF
ncbi:MULTISPECIES: acyl-CoA dehydrogenase family protein [Comamonadaceae]|uniref:acyl-CoA dehydrogenase family protein n=1 Tax=Comamonadaceae TaxID=80864 RepID=UPI0027190815|nr:MULTISPECIES: acyl-CoA dehydrogenase family protein [Comamonadaceae]MDO9143481.1 acyl-CoA dehydrogenase family protein [Rhodoferax sp.]MDP3884964.1 acyl-CoA dehydrogenase family protein [Hydrogenophaga sp.]